VVRLITALIVLGYGSVLLHLIDWHFILFADFDQYQPVAGLVIGTSGPALLGVWRLVQRHRTGEQEPRPGAGLVLGAAVIEFLLALLVLATLIGRLVAPTPTDTEFVRTLGLITSGAVAVSAAIAAIALMRHHYSSSLLLLVPIALLAMSAVLLLSQAQDETDELLGLGFLTVWAAVPVIIVWRPRARALLT
jgi:hypothetical protein